MKGHKKNSESSAIVTLADCSWRLRKFMTKTILIEQEGKKVVRKLAITEEAKPFLLDIRAAEETNAKYLKGHFDVLCGRLEDSYIEYDYMPYQSLNQKIASELRENHYKEADQLFIDYVQKVLSLNKVHVCPKDFLSMVTLDTGKNWQLQAECLSPGLLDLTPRNILVNGSRWVVVDNEWSFDFPIPVVFLLFRAIKETAVEVQHEIRRYTHKTRPAISIFVQGLKTFYVPKSWVKYISDNHISFAQMLRWELGFREHIAGQASRTVGRIKMNPKIRIYFSAWHINNNTMLIENASNFLKKLPALRQLVHFFERMLLFLKK